MGINGRNLTQEPRKAGPILRTLAILVMVITHVVAERAVWGAEEKIVQEISGNRSQTLDPVTMTGPWEVRWQSAGPRFTLVIQEQDNPNKAAGLTVANIIGSGTGSSFRSRGGRFYLDVIAHGDWTVTVVELP
jgi:hypothetical protein